MNRADCGKRQPGGVLRCELEQGHIGLHQSFNPDAVWMGSKDANRAALKRTKIKQSSAKQDERTAFLHGIMAERMWQQRLHTSADLGRGFNWCETCKRQMSDSDEAWIDLTVSHIESRNDTSTRYERRREPEFRGDSPHNILLECAPCNLHREPTPQWSKP